MKKLALAVVLCFFCIGCEEDYSGSVKANSTAGKVKSVEVKLPRSGTIMVLRK